MTGEDQTDAIIKPRSRHFPRLPHSMPFNPPPIPLEPHSVAFRIGKANDQGPFIGAFKNDGDGPVMPDPLCRDPADLFVIRYLLHTFDPCRRL